MASIPDPNDANRRVFSGRTNIVDMQAGSVERAAANAAANQGEQARATSSTIATFGANVAEMAEKEKVRLDDVRLEEHKNNLVRRADARMVEALAVKGTGVMTDNYVSSQLANLAKDNEELTGQLSNASQKERAVTMYDDFSTKYGGVLMRHAIAETDKVEESNYVNGVQAQTDFAVNNATSPEITMGSAEGIRTYTINRLTKLNATPEEIALRTQEAVGAMHLRVIATLREKGNTSYANQYLKENMADMSTAQAEAAAKSLRDITEHEQGTSVGATAMDMSESGATPKAVQEFINSQKLPEGALQSAKRFIQENEKARADTDAETAYGLVNGFLAGKRDSAAIAAIKRSPGYASLTEEGKNFVLTRTENEVASADVKTTNAKITRRNEYNAAQHELKTSTATVLKMAEFIDDPALLASMTPAAIAGMGKAIGDDNVKELTVMKARFSKGAARLAIAKPLLDASVAGIADPEKRKLALAYASLSLGQWKAENPDKIPTEAQQVNIVNAGRMAWVNKEGEIKARLEVDLAKKTGENIPVAFKDLLPGVSFPNALDAYRQFVVKYQEIKADAAKRGIPQPSEQEVAAKFARYWKTQQQSDVPTFNIGR